MKVLQSKLLEGEQIISKLKNKRNIEVTRTEEIAEVVESFYTKLYTAKKPQSTARVRSNIVNNGSEEIPKITKR